VAPIGIEEPELAQVAADLLVVYSIIASTPSSGPVYYLNTSM